MPHHYGHATSPRKERTKRPWGQFETIVVSLRSNCPGSIPLVINAVPKQWMNALFLTTLDVFHLMEFAYLPSG